MKRAIFCIALLFASLQANPKVIAKFGAASCPWSQELKKEIWDSSTFQALLEGAGVERAEMQTQEVSEMVPTLILISSTGEEIGRLGFLPAPPEKYVDLIKEMLSIHTLCQSLSSLNAQQLLHLYRKAEVLHMTASAEKILQEGLKKDQGVDFLIAQYASLIREHPRRARSIKEEIRARRKDQIATEWELALISFQMRQEKLDDTAKIVLPIKKFLRKYEDESLDYAWKCHFILAEFYRSKKETEKMRFHRDQARKSAPEELKKIIESS